MILMLKHFKENGTKDSKHIGIQEKINFTRYVEDELKYKDITYDLVPTVTYIGKSVPSGHYTGCAKVSNDYVQFDDLRITKLSLDRVLKEDVYILFYELAKEEMTAKLVNLKKVQVKKTFLVA